MTFLSLLGGGFKSGQQPVMALAWAKIPHRRSPALPYRRQLHPDSGKLVPVVMGIPDHVTPPRQMQCTHGKEVRRAVRVTVLPFGDFSESLSFFELTIILLLSLDNDSFHWHN